MFKLKRALLAAWRAFKADLASIDAPSQPEAAPLYQVEMGVNAGAAEVAPVVHGACTEPAQSATEALAALVPAPSADELIAKFNRFMLERAPTHPLEAVQVGAFISGLAEGLAPALAQLREAVAAATPTPSAPADPVN